MQRWGVGEDVPIDLPGAVASTVGDFSDIDDNLPLLAIRGFGQNDDQMVPLHMAMVAATVANDGAMMKPFVVDAELDHDGNVISRTQPEVWKRPISRETAGTLQRPDGRRRRARHGELLHRPQQRDQRGRQDRHGAAQRSRRAASARTPGSSPTPRSRTRSTWWR